MFRVLAQAQEFGQLGILSRWFGYLLLLLVLVFGIFFSLQNDTKVPLDLLILRLPEQSTALWILLAFAAGGVAGIVISGVALVKQRSRIGLLQRRLDKSQRELNQLRTADLKPALGKNNKASKALPQ